MPKVWKKEVIALKSSCPFWSCGKIEIGIESSFCVVVSGQFNYTKGTASMPFILPALLSFQGSAHLFGVGSFSQKIYVSELSRSQDTAKILFPNEEYFESQLINEVPLKSSFDTKMNMPLLFWNLVGRLQWFVNSRRQAETRRQTRERAKEFVKLIRNDDIDVAVVTHGFYMHTLLQEMKKVGFRMTGSSVKFKNGEYVIAEK